MTGEMSDVEVNLARQVAFIRRLAEAGAFTTQETNTFLARIAEESAAVARAPGSAGTLAYPGTNGAGSRLSILECGRLYWLCCWLVLRRRDAR